MVEVALLISTCFLVNYVTADGKTNWAEGLSMVVFYTLIVRPILVLRRARLTVLQGLLAWYYKGQTSIANFLTCGTVADAVANPSSSY